MHAFIIEGSDLNICRQKADETLRTWKATPFDVIELNGNEGTITISQVRQFKRDLSLKPVSGGNIFGTIIKAENLTVEAQNALLKLIEEPAANARFLFTTSNINKLLPTIISRCQVIKTGPVILDGSDSAVSKFIDKLLQSSPGQMVQAFEKEELTSANATNYINDLIINSHRKLMDLNENQIDFKNRESILNISKLCRYLLTAKSQIEVNVSVKSALISAFL